MISQEFLKDRFVYDPETGDFYYRKSDKKCGYINHSGYRYITICYKTYIVHRLIWVYMTGSYPPEDIDHINRNRLDNRWVNLRAVSRSENSKNRSVSKKNSSGYPGVGYNKRDEKFYAAIMVDGERHYLGYYDSAEEAGKAYKEASLYYYKEFSPYWLDKNQNCDRVELQT